jgi:hypothetical protein
MAAAALAIVAGCAAPPPVRLEAPSAKTLAYSSEGRLFISASPEGNLVLERVDAEYHRRTVIYRGAAALGRVEAAVQSDEDTIDVRFPERNIRILWKKDDLAIGPKRYTTADAGTYVLSPGGDLVASPR